MDNRGVSTVVEKLLALSIVVLYIGLLTATLYGGAVPAYRTTVGAEVGDRTLATAAARVEQAVPPATRRASVRVQVDLPPTIDGTGYELNATGGDIVLTHPDPAIGGRIELVLPTHVRSVSGEWQSGGVLIVSVRGDAGAHVVTLGGAG
ncbi:MAG: hypothetical protein ABEH35_04585 [Haloarculaceae archaeon]